MQLVNFTKSIFWGSEGSYNVPGTDAVINFEKGNKTSDTEKSFVDLFNRYVIENKIFQVATLGYMYLLAQGIAYEVATRILFNKDLRSIHTNDKNQSVTTLTTTGFEVKNEVVATIISKDNTTIAPWKRSLCAIAGTIGSIAFSSFKLLLALSLRSYITTPIAAVLAIGSVFYISLDLIRSAQSFMEENDEGLGYIREKIGNKHAMIAGAIIVGQCALATFFAIRMI